MSHAWELVVGKTDRGLPACRAERGWRTGALAVLAVLMAHTPAYAQKAAATAHKLVVVELFQSQGCSSCPPAEANLNAVASTPGVLALSFGVTYWDSLGWKDTFATDAYTQRQWAYAHYRGRNTVWTPQIYVNGHTDLVGTERAQLDDAIAEAHSDGPLIQWLGDQLIVKGAAKAQRASDVWLVRYDPRTQLVPIGAGENGGRTLPQRNVVRELDHLGSWQGGERRYPLPAPSMSGLSTAVLVQIADGGEIQSAALQPPRN